MKVTFQRQKQYYDKKVHGQPYNVDDLVSLYSPVLPPGQSKNLYHPWSGPFKVLKRLSDTTYWIVDTRASDHRQVVHFDLLKLCLPNTNLPPVQQASQSPTLASSSAPPTVPFGTILQLVDEDHLTVAPRCYPDRVHRPPVHYTDTDT